MHGTLQKAVVILGLFDRANLELGATELAQQLNEPVSTVHDLLKSMAAIGLLDLSAKGKYQLGWEIVRLGRLRYWQTQCKAEIQRSMHRLADQFDMVASYSILDGEHWIIVDMVSGSGYDALEPPNSLYAKSGFHAAGAKVLWAHRPWDELLCVIEKNGFLPNKSSPEVLVAAYHRELEQIVKDGYAISYGSNWESIAAPIYHLSQPGQILGALMLSGKPGTISARLHDFGEQLVGACQALSQELRHVSDPLEMGYPF